MNLKTNMKNHLITAFLVIASSMVGTTLYYNFVQTDDEMLGATITTIQGSDTLKDSRSVINTNFANLNADKMEVSTTSVDNITTLSNLTTVGTIGTGIWQGTVIDHERGGLEANVSAYSGLVSITGGATAEVNSISELNALLAGESVASTTWEGATSILTVGTIGAGVWQGTAVGTQYGGTGQNFSSSNGLIFLNAGTSYAVATGTLAGNYLNSINNDINLDIEIYTGAIEFIVSSSTMATTTSFKAFKFPVATTITNVYGYCYNGTTTIMFDERGATTPKTGGTDIWASGFVVGEYNATNTFSNASVAAGAYINLDIDGFFVGTPTDCRINIEATKDD